MGVGRSRNRRMVRLLRCLGNRDFARSSRPGPLNYLGWYHSTVSGTHTVLVGDRGRLVLPAEVRQRAGLVEGSKLVLVETPSGLVLMTQRQVRDRVRKELSGLDLVGELIAERRSESAIEDQA